MIHGLERPTLTTLGLTFHLKKKNDFKQLPLLTTHFDMTSVPKGVICF